MRVLIFGDPFLAPRTRRALGGELVDLQSHELEAVDTLFIQAGALIAQPPAWKTKKPIYAVGATLEEEEWQRHIKNPSRYPRPHAKSFFLSAAAVKKLNQLRRRFSFWQSLEKLRVKTWIEPQLRNWIHKRLRVLQVVTSVQVGGAEKVCLDLATMPECVGVVAWGEPRRTVLRPANWDLSSLPASQRLTALLQLAKRLHVDVIHTHLLSADLNCEIEKHFPIITTIHNMPDAWPQGYESAKPGLVVGCSREVTKALGGSARTAWNGVTMALTQPRKKRSRKNIALVAVANYRSQKQLHKLPPILKALQAKGFSPRLTLVGELHYTDPDSKRSRYLFWSAAKRAKVTKRISEVQTLDVRPVLAESDVFVNVSAYEGLSLAQLEALGAGLPVVATDVGGAREIQSAVTSGAYTTVPVNATAAQFAKAIISACDIPRKNHLPQQFTSTAMKRRYLWLYYSALACSPKSDEIWLVTNNFSMGGAQTSARRLLKRWREHAPVRAFTLQEKTPTNGSRALVACGVPVENLSGASAEEHAFALVKRAAARRPRAILFWNTMPHQKCLIADALHIPCIDVSPGEMFYKEMDDYLREPRCELPIRERKDYGRLLHTGVVKYARERDTMSAYLGCETTVIPNGVEDIAPTKRTFKGALVFGTAARIAPHKRLEDLIDAFAGVPAQLLIAGKVEKGAEVYARMLKKRAGKNVIWAGEQEISAFLPRIDIFVMISEPAGCPNASLEAMRSGLPLIITDVGGANEQALPGLNGWLVPPRNPGAMKKAIEEALRLPPEALRVMARASLYHVTKFSMEEMLSRYMALVP